MLLLTATQIRTSLYLAHTLRPSIYPICHKSNTSDGNVISITSI